VPPPAAKNAVIPLIMTPLWLGLSLDFVPLDGPISPHWSPNKAPPFIDHLSEVWKLRSDRTI
jgi:hypothetical protein